MPTDLRIDADNRPGVLAAIAGALGSAGVNIVGYCGVGAGGKGSIHLLVDDAAALARPWRARPHHRRRARGVARGAARTAPATWPRSPS